MSDIPTDALDALCRIHGIAPGYTDTWGRTQHASDATRLALLEALGVLDARRDLAAALREAQTQEFREALPPVAVFEATSPPYRLRLRVAEHDAQASFEWRFVLEGGEVHSGTFRPCDLDALGTREFAGERFLTIAFDWNDILPPGYHRYSLSGPGVQATTLVVIAPARCYLPPALKAGERIWGPALQLYGLRSGRNWGIGDFTDLRTVIEQWGRRGAAVTGVNPLHALFPHNPAHASPYSPSSRLFLNMLYIDVEAVPDARECAEVLAAMSAGAFQSALQAARASPLVDYPAVAALKVPLLERLHRHFREHHLAPGSERARAFRRFQAEGGRRLREHALFEALQEHFHREDPSVWGWPAWPEAYRHPQAPEVARFAELHAERVEFYHYLQWLAASQLGAASAAASALGCAVGLYQDLAISVDRGGAESWANQDLYAVGASVGAPPDELNLAGQNWGLPPIRPERLRAQAYEAYIATLRANMRCAGALRIDHVMGLARLYWIPPGATAAEGAYVRYPVDDLLAILALESHRNHCMVIGEDLGTVPGELRARLARAGVLSYRLFYFERDAAGEFKAPADYPVDALVAASTHDLAPLASFWEGHDLELRRTLGLFPSEELRAQYVASRAGERAGLALALEREGLLPEGTPVAAQMTPALGLAIHEHLAQTPSRVLVVQPEDLLGLIEQVNVPGTTGEHSNWRRKLPLTLEEIGHDERFEALTGMLARVRPAALRAPGPRPRIPRATYRLQLSGTFTFAHATALIPYLARLGVSDVYCSPYLRARAGSAHGYDVIDHSALNPEIGGSEDFERFVAALRAHGMGHLLDMVPNHMGIMGADNAWWLDVLENGPASAYADFFDIDWQPANPALANKVLVPVLGEQYGRVLERGELTLAFSAESGEFSVCYFEHRFPVDPREYPRILEAALSRLRAPALPDDALADLASLANAFGHLPAREDTRAARRTERARDKDVHKRRLARLVAEHPAIGAAITDAVATFNGEPADGAGCEALHALLERQAYRLSSWRVAADEINYRRFFDVNELAALRMENEEAFEATHRYVLGLAAQGWIDGLRIDHPDGLYDPGEYFRRLQERYAQLAGAACDAPEHGAPHRPLYVVAEKIAAHDEKLPESWAVHGTSGYRFAAFVTGVLAECEAGDEMERIYRGFAPDAPAYDEAVYDGKREIMQTALASPLIMLSTELVRIAHADRRTRDYTLNSLRSALHEIVACFPVYRTYITDTPSAQDRRYIEHAVSEARARTRAADATVYDFVQRMLLAEADEDASPELKARILAFAMKVQQFTAPVTAKGVEDTASYRYHRLVSLNDVAGDPGRFGVTLEAFHAASAERAANRPHTLLATSTHDNKRSEDVRARIDVISEMPAAWRRLASRWARMNRGKKTLVDATPAPSPNDEYLLYQTLVGTFPAGEPGDRGVEAYRGRIEAYMLKAVREAKLHTSWINTNSAYESAMSGFVRALLAPGKDNRFLTDLRVRAAPIAWFGMLNSISMTMLKLTSPGVPDIYQGNESADLSLVDPDNRRPVDYAARLAMLDELARIEAAGGYANAVRGLAETALDGRAKMWVVWRLLGLRQAQSDVFGLGHYRPLEVHGAHASHVIAFAREHEGASVITIAGRLWMKLGGEAGTAPLGAAVWGDTAIDAGALSGPFVNVLTGASLDIREGRIALADAFADFPGAVLRPAAALG